MSSSNVETGSRNEKEIKNVPIYNVNLQSSPNSCLAKLQGKYLRCLVDTGAEISLISQATYEGLKYRPQLTKRNIALQSANGSSLRVTGQVELDFKIANIKLRHTFVVVSNLNRKIILGRDLLCRYGLCLFLISLS